MTDRDRSLYVRCEGIDTPLIMLEGGLGGRSSDWEEGQLARSTRVCACDRAGEGQSDPASDSPHDASDVARDLDAILLALDIDGPIVLAGFSFGGLLARYYAPTRHDTIAVLALIDPTPPVWTVMNLSGASLETRIDSLLSFSGISESSPERVDLLKASEQVFMVAAPASLS